MHKKLLQSALSYLHRGFSVIPVGDDKQPLIQWEAFQTRHPNEEEVRAWFQKPEVCGIGLVCGQISGNLVVLAVGKEVDLKGLSLPKTSSVLLESGVSHFYFRVDPSMRVQSMQFQDPQALYGEGRFIIAPPSYMTGGQYKWQTSLDECSPAPIPDWLLQKAKDHSLVEIVDEKTLNISKPDLIDVSQFKPITLQELQNVLSLTIKNDVENKTIAFLCGISAFTADSQINISFNAPSSTGKSFIPIEVLSLFPTESVKEIGYCSPTAFFHDHGAYDKERNCYLVDLSRKILIFLDQPHNMLLAHLRPLLSHDKKEIIMKITDKTQKAGMKTKNITMRGFPSVIFCTAGLNVDEQESTRFLLLSPEINQDKIRLAVEEKIRKETDRDKYSEWLESDLDRRLLKQRIAAIKQEGIDNIKLCSETNVREKFFATDRNLKPRHQRDIGRIIAIIKAIALINLWWRERDGSTIIANTEDIEAGFAIWDKISTSQELNLPPYVYHFYLDIILEAWRDKNKGSNSSDDSNGLSRKDILKWHIKRYGRTLDPGQLRQQLLPMLEMAGLIYQEPDHEDLRQKLTYPTDVSSISVSQTYRETDGGVDPQKPLF